MYCPFCGFELPDDAIYCQRCGKKLPHYSSTLSQSVTKEEISSPAPNPLNSVRNCPDNCANDAQNLTMKKGLFGRIFGVAFVVSCVIIILFASLIIFAGISGDVSPSEPYKNERVAVIVTSNPSNATVHIAGEFKGITPITLQLTPNTGYTIVLNKNGYGQWAKSVNTGDGSKPIAVHATLTPAYVNVPTYTPTQVPTTPTTPTQIPTTSTSGTIDKQYVWEYGDYTWTTDVSIQKSTYSKYRSLSRTNDFNTYVSDANNREIVRSIANSIVEAGDECGYVGDEHVLMAVAFVQSIPYRTDIESSGRNEYYKYPVETLVDGCGDCEDSAILTAAIIRELGYGAVLLVFDNHVAVGVKGGENVYGTYWTYNGDRYFYLETTAKGWGIGDIPDEYKNERARIIALN